MDNFEQDLTYEFVAENGRKIMLPIRSNRVYGIVESKLHKFKFCSSFPWLKLETVPIVSFRISRSTYPSEILDPCYSVRMTAQAFARMIGIKFKAYEESMLKETLLHG